MSEKTKVNSSNTEVKKRRGRPKKVTAYAKDAKKVENKDLQNLANLDWLHTLLKVIVLITAVILSLIWRNFHLTEAGTTIVLLVLGFDFIALIISCLAYLMGLLLEDNKMIDNSVKLMEFFVDVIICVILYLLAFHVRITWMYAGIMVMISYTVLSKDKKKVYLSYMVAIIVIIIYYFIIG